MVAGLTRLSLAAPAKLNLFLHVLGRRPDGYHRLQTVFQLLDFGDTISIERRTDGRVVRVNDVAGVPAADDLVVRAAHLLKDAANVGEGAAIIVKKEIPIGGGLGGGSSDAAAVLVGLDQLWETKLGVERLAGLGLALGADVPVFVRGHSAFADGIGEELTPINLPERWFLVLDPRVSVSTAAVFQAPELTRDSAPLTIADFVAGRPTRNDLEPVVRGRYAEVARALDWLGLHATARMTGSGACVFASFESEAQARRVASEVPAEFGWFVARGISVSPLLDCF